MHSEVTYELMVHTPNNRLYSTSEYLVQSYIVRGRPGHGFRRRGPFENVAELPRSRDVLAQEVGVQCVLRYVFEFMVGSERR